MVWHWLTDSFSRRRLPVLDPNAVPLPVKRKVPPAPALTKPAAVLAAAPGPFVEPNATPAPSAQSQAAPEPQPSPESQRAPALQAAPAPASAPVPREALPQAKPDTSPVAAIRLTSALAVVTQPRGLDVTPILEALGQAPTKAKADAPAPIKAKKAEPETAEAPATAAPQVTPVDLADLLPALAPVAAQEPTPAPVPAPTTTTAPPADHLETLPPTSGPKVARTEEATDASPVTLTSVPLSQLAPASDDGPFTLTTVPLADLMPATATTETPAVEPAVDAADSPVCVADASVLATKQPAEERPTRIEHLPLLELETLVVPTVEAAGTESRNVSGTRELIFPADLEALTGEPMSRAQDDEALIEQTIQEGGAASLPPDESWQHHLRLARTESGHTCDERQSEMPVGLLLRSLDTPQTWRRLITTFLEAGIGQGSLVSAIAIAEARGWVSLTCPEPDRTFNLAAFLCDTGLLDLDQVTRMTNESEGFRACDFTVFCRELLGNKMLSLGQVGFLHRMGRLVSWYVAVTDGFCPMDAAH